LLLSVPERAVTGVMGCVELAYSCLVPARRVAIQRSIATRVGALIRLIWQLREDKGD
jgi:hypothetical protein